MQYALYDALVSINVPADKARAVVESMEQDMITVLATKADLNATQLLLKQEIGAVRDSLKQEIGAVRDSLNQKIDSNRVLLEHKIDQQSAALTIRLGSMMVVVLGLMFAALKLV